MGHQERLGVGSRVEELDAGKVRMVLERVGTLQRAAVVAAARTLCSSGSGRFPYSLRESGPLGEIHFNSAMHEL